MKIKLVACDLDGTLLTDELKISRRTAETIRRAQAAGVKFCIATGRMFRSALRFAEELALDTPLIAYNGALLKDVRTGEVYFSQPMELTAAREVLDFARNNGLYVQKYIDDQLYVEKINEQAASYSYKVRVEAKEQGPDFYRLDTPPDKLLFIVEPARRQAIIEELLGLFAGRASITSSSPRFVEVLNHNVSKGAALCLLARLFSLNPEEVMACGDSHNDLEMLTYAGVSVAMGNAEAPVKSAADFVTAGNEADGVALALEKFVL